MYNNLLNQTKSLLGNERNFLSNSSNFASIVFHLLPNINWAGFYFFDGVKLILGPFQGKTACVNIKIGKGVCGKSFSSEKTIIVADVNKFDGHIACSAESKSEIVVPIFCEQKIVGVFDIDSPILNRFDENDKENLELILKEFEFQTDLSNLDSKIK